MRTIKKGDIVARKSYNKDVIFIVELIIDNKIAILTGVTTRLKADSVIDDLELVGKKEISNIYKNIDEKISKKIDSKERVRNNFLSRSDKIVYTGRILHLDGDRKYSEKSSMYYKKMGLNAVVRNIAENRQANVVNSLIDMYKPDILVVTRTWRND